MALEMKQSQQMRQGLRMTPQLLQAIRLRLLQLSHIELTEVIEEQMVENPMLERDVDSQDEEAERDVWETASAEAQEETSAREAMNEIDWERYLENYSSPLPAGGVERGGEELPSIDQTHSVPVDLGTHLLAQLAVVESDELHRKLAEVIIGNLDEHGYLRGTDLREIAESFDVELGDVELALELVHELEPAGVGARDLRECLLIQARQLEPPCEDLLRLIRDHLRDLQHGRYRTIARALERTEEEVITLHRTLRTLEPKPGRAFAPITTSYIQPDIYIERREDEWIASLNNDGLPRLRVSNAYRSAIRKNADSDAKQYVQEKLRSASWLIQSIEQRQQTILKVTRSIIRFQRDFFEHGIKHLRPLVLRQVADDIGMHESTVSRVTTNKYVHTPRGIFELKFFFDSSVRKEGGDDLAAAAVKRLMKDIIDNEPPRKPLSDQKLVEILREMHDIDIARRTVAKYRESMGIESSSRRRKYL